MSAVLDAARVRLIRAAEHTTHPERDSALAAAVLETMVALHYLHAADTTGAAFRAVEARVAAEIAKTGRG